MSAQKYVLITYLVADEGIKLNAVSNCDKLVLGVTYFIVLFK